MILIFQTLKLYTRNSVACNLIRANACRPVELGVLVGCIRGCLEVRHLAALQRWDCSDLGPNIWLTIWVWVKIRYPWNWIVGTRKLRKSAAVPWALTFDPFIFHGGKNSQLGQCWSLPSKRHGKSWQWCVGFPICRWFTWIWGTGPQDK